MTLNEKNTEEKIFETAREVFTEKGFEGARMEEISQRAGINKALLHYYYRTKEKLFNAIFDKVMGDFFKEVMQMMSSEATLNTKIEFFVDKYITLVLKNPHIPYFIINELNRNPQRLVAIIENTPVIKDNGFEKFKAIVENEVNMGNIEPITPHDLIINIIALSIFPIIAKPIIQGVIFKNDKKQYNLFIEKRKKEVSRFVINAITKK
jgi:TetR/AcrR family transcriptional regulator